MQVYISAEVADDEDHWSHLDVLLCEYLVSKLHDWDAANADALVESPWASARNRSQGRLRKLFTERFHRNPLSGLPLGAPNPRPPLRVEVHPTTPETRGHRLSPSDILKYLQHKPAVVVENSRSDGAFLRALCDAFKRETLAKAFDGAAVELIHAGGCADIYRHFEERISRAPRGPLRVLAMRDSDALYPGHEDKELRALRESFEDHKERLRILSVREIENCLTCACIQHPHQPEAPPTPTDALERLTPAQRAHYDLKRGFQSDTGALTKAYRELGDKEKEEVRARREALYAGVDKTALFNGFTKKVGERYERAEVRAVYKREDIEAELGRHIAAELEALLNAIEELL